MIRNLFIGIFMAVAAAGSWAQEAKEMVYPQAEWCKAGNILMHTPGQELFNGVIHPSAGLFENYFDVDKAAEEHENYIKMLEANGIQVYKVTDILKQMSIDDLLRLASKELNYDISDIPDEDPEKTEEYRQKVFHRCWRHRGRQGCSWRHHRERKENTYQESGISSRGGSLSLPHDPQKSSAGMRR